MLSPLDSVAGSLGCRCGQGIVLFQHRKMESVESLVHSSFPLFLALKTGFVQHCVAESFKCQHNCLPNNVRICRLMNSNHCINVCHIITDLKLHKCNYSCVCSEWIALSHYIDIKILIRLCCWTVFLSQNKHHVCTAVSACNTSSITRAPFKSQSSRH